MAKDIPLGSDADDAEIFDSVNDDGGADHSAPEGGDDREVVSEAIRGKPRGDLAEMSAAIKAAHFGQQQTAAATPAPVAEPAAPKNDSVPLATFLELQREVKELRRGGQQPQQQAPQQQQPAVDLSELLYTDPNAFVQTLNQQYERKIAEVRLDADLRFAEARNADIWESAWNGFLERVDGGRDPALYSAVMNSRSPGQAIADWYKQEQMRTEIGGDLNAYRERLRAELLAEMQGELGSPAPAPGRQSAPARGPNGQFQPAAQVTRLPTSLSRMAGRATDADGDDGDGSEEAIFNAGRSRRR